MSFRKEYAKDLAREVKQIKKVLPYTVREFASSNELMKWKIDRTAKEAKWEATRADRYEKAKARAVNVLEGTRQYIETENDTADKRYEKLAIQDARIKIDTAREQLGFQKMYEPKQKASMWGKLLNFFLDINFEPKTK